VETTISRAPAGARAALPSAVIKRDGTLAAFDATKIAAALARAGVTLAVTTEERATRLEDGPLRLPRKVIPDQPLGLLATRLERLAWGR